MRADALSNPLPGQYLGGRADTMSDPGSLWWNPFITDEEAEAQRGQTSCSQSNSYSLYWLTIQVVTEWPTSDLFSAE